MEHHQHLLRTYSVQGGKESSEMENPGFSVKDEDKRRYTDSSAQREWARS